MRETTLRKRESADQGGFALILAILALLLLTFLGLTLAVTTSTELQIAYNYRWGQQAWYNADAGIEIGKHHLVDSEWGEILPALRGAWDPKIPPGFPPMPFALYTRAGPEGEPSRNFQLADCDTYANEGYGAVLDDPTAMFPWQNSSQYLGERLNGTFTLWIRRRILTTPAGLLCEEGSCGDPALDAGLNQYLVLTAEGTAPFGEYAGTGGGDVATTTLALSNRAVRYLEVTLSKVAPGDCENRAAQAGAGPTGAGFDQCDPIRKEGINPRGGGAPGSTAEVSPGTQ